ncbi:hypothetical protein T03_7272 [Trichinella britovi]|uniref:Uncharacterized protein n=1 Tax=Trichinella britovi TaxID=45882 RepID=A0A0V1CSJ7_TRIBR|nr:hypothetical protein T03_7272 [Trichinella britovi]
MEVSRGKKNFFYNEHVYSLNPLVTLVTTKEKNFLNKSSHFSLNRSTSIFGTALCFRPTSMSSSIAVDTSPGLDSIAEIASSNTSKYWLAMFSNSLLLNAASSVSSTLLSFLVGLVCFGMRSTSLADMCQLAVSVDSLRQPLTTKIPASVYGDRQRLSKMDSSVFSGRDNVKIKKNSMLQLYSSNNRMLRMNVNLVRDSDKANR